MVVHRVGNGATFNGRRDVGTGESLHALLSRLDLFDLADTVFSKKLYLHRDEGPLLVDPDQQLRRERS